MLWLYVSRAGTTHDYMAPNTNIVMVPLCDVHSRCPKQDLGGMVVFIDIPMKATSLKNIWDPRHYIPTMPLADWTPLLPPGESTVTSYIRFLEDPSVPSRVFQLGIYVGTMNDSKVGGRCEGPVPCTA